MSSRILVCPQCNNVASLVELPAETVTDLVRDLLAASRRNPAWQVRAHWCPQCDTPIIEAWPAKEPVGKRRELVGLPADLLKIEEEVPNG